MNEEENYDLMRRSGKIRCPMVPFEVNTRELGSRSDDAQQKINEISRDVAAAWAALKVRAQDNGRRIDALERGERGESTSGYPEYQAYVDRKTGIVSGDMYLEPAPSDRELENEVDDLPEYCINVSRTGTIKGGER